MMGDAAVALRARFGSAASPSYRAAALTTAVLANNVPDFDFLYVGITGGRLGYLLHHRGHTHTLAAAPLLALLGVALVAFGFRLGKASAHAPATSRTWACCATLGCVLHVFMDFGNNYGVHPFWPLYDGWLYGDAIFIIDPWLIIVLVGMGVGVSASRSLRGALRAGALGLLALAWAVAADVGRARHRADGICLDLDRGAVAGELPNALAGGRRRARDAALGVARHAARGARQRERRAGA